MAVTIDRQRRTVFGNKRIVVAQLDIGSDADTWNTGLKFIDSASVISNTNNAIGFTKSGGVITFQTGGAETDAHLIAIGN